MMQRTVDEAAEALREELGIIEMEVLTNFTIADALREANKANVEQCNAGWGNGVQMCAWSAIGAVARARGLA